MLTRKVYSYKWPNDTNKQAEIHFALFKGGEMKFERCTYTGVNSTYDLADWAFLKDLAIQIKILVEYNRDVYSPGKGTYKCKVKDCNNRVLNKGWCCKQCYIEFHEPELEMGVRDEVNTR